MNTISHSLFQRDTVKGAIIDIFALVFIYLVPAITHLLSLPLYLVEPMRVILIISLVHSSKTNAYFLALSMPVFSFLVSGHPVVPKMMLIAVELTLNVFLFFLLSKRMKHLFPAIFASIILSKAVYYLLKFFLIQLLIIDSGLVTTPLLMQLATSIIFSIYLASFYKPDSGAGKMKTR